MVSFRFPGQETRAQEGLFSSRDLGSENPIEHYGQEIISVYEYRQQTQVTT